MIVLNVAHPFAAVGADPIGGGQQVISLLDARLVHEHHASIVLAARGSQAAGHVVTTPAHTGWIDTESRARTRERYRRLIAQLVDDHAVELVHYHGGDYAEYAPELHVPQLATLHAGGGDPGAAPHVARVCVSQSQRRALPAELAIADVIEHGIAIERYRPSAHKAGFVLALGRICPEKGFDLALAAARAAGLPLLLGGSVMPYLAHHRYATEVLEPLLDADRRWIGPVAGTRKRELLASARCVVIPSQVDETTSLVAMEALAAGTPVVAFARGALPEIVEHGVTGILVDDPAALPDALVRAGRISGRACRARACERFNASRMTSRYLELYRGLALRPRRHVACVSITTTDRELVDVAAEWEALCDRCASATAFQRPTWLLAWRRWFGAGGEPRVALLRRGGRLVGVVPLERRGDTVRLIGEGITEYCDAVVEPDIDGAIIEEAVVRAAEGAGRLELAALRPCSRLSELRLGGSLVDAEPSTAVSLDALRIPPRVYYESRRLARYAPRWHDESADPTRLLAGLVGLHRARWGRRGGLCDPTVQGFHGEVVTALARRGLLRMIGLELDGALRAVLYGFADHGRWHVYLSGLDPNVAKLSPGRLAFARAVERALDESAFELDFLRGREPYKYEWGAVDRPIAMYRAELANQ